MSHSKSEGLTTVHEEMASSTLVVDKIEENTTKKISSTSTNDSEIGALEADDYPPMTFRRAMVLLSLTFLLVTSAVPNFFLTGALSYTVADIGGEKSIAWIGMSNTLACAAAVPFAGAISDLLGRRYVALLGAGLVIIGVIVVGLAHRVEIAIGGMTIVGVGAGLAEVVAGAAVSEMAPVKSRGKYIGTAFLFILPFGACATYAQLYSASSTWRWGAWISAILVGVNFIFVWVFYRPPPRPNSAHLTRREIIARVDFLGGILSISGFSIFLLGIQWGGYTYPWGSPQVVSTIVIGALLIIAFIVWENYARYPMFPRHLFQNKRVSVITLFITAISGANFWSLVGLWPLECHTLFGPDPTHVIHVLTVCGFSIVLGVILVNWGLTAFRGANRELICISCCLMTAGVGALATVTPDTPSLGIGLSLLGGLGVGGLVQPTGTILTIISPDEFLATIVSACISIRLIGGTIGYAVYFNILQNTLTNVLPVKVGLAAIKAGIPISQIEDLVIAVAYQNTSALAHYSPLVLTAVTEAYKASYVEGFRLIYLVSIAFGGAAIIASLFLGDIRKYMVDRVAVDIR